MRVREITNRQNAMEQFHRAGIVTMYIVNFICLNNDASMCFWILHPLERPYFEDRQIQVPGTAKWTIFTLIRKCGDAFGARYQLWISKIWIDKCDKNKMTFTFQHALYRFLQVSLTLKNTPSTFQRAIYNILLTIKSQATLVNLGDIFIF